MRLISLLWVVTQAVLADPSASVPNVGHGKKTPDRYNIYGAECHTAANRSICNAPKGAKVGVLQCQGSSTMDVRFHTASWYIFKTGKSCIFNWGQKCCWDDAAHPNLPDIAGGRAKTCAQWACGAQYSPAATRPLVADKYVQRTGPFLCLVLTTGGRTDLPLDQEAKYHGEELLNSCVRCCNEKADFWGGDGGANSTAQFQRDREEFRHKCRRVCGGAIEIP